MGNTRKKNIIFALYLVLTVGVFFGFFAFSRLKTGEGDNTVDCDLTVLSEIMAYSEMSRMLSYPEEYNGKTIKIAGNLAQWEENGEQKYAVERYDATACCAVLLPFTLRDGAKLKNKKSGSFITITGIYDSGKIIDATPNI